MPSDAAVPELPVAVVVPTLNAEAWLPALLGRLASNNPRPRRILFIDSASDDRSLAQIQAAGHEVMRIERREFGHGRTRNLAARQCLDCEFVVFLTQDACPVGDDWLPRLLQPFSDPQVAVVFGRQLARPGAGSAERFAREFNYPDRSERSQAADLARRGVRAVFCSNSFAAYRQQALMAVGGFPEQLPLGEDMAVTLRLLNAGHARVYESAACAVHSHDHAPLDELRRYFDIGALMVVDPELRRLQPTTSGEGLRFLRGELAAAWASGRPAELLRVLLRTAGKLMGFSLGRRYQWVPAHWRHHLSSNRRYWGAG